MRIAVIPARGGSKRIPRKNVKAFHGLPMISYAISAARRSGVFDKVIVSTDDAEIGAIARDCGAETPFARPSELADDHTPTVPVIAHAIGACREMGWVVGDVCCVYPCAPFVAAEDIRSGHGLLDEGLRAYVFPVASFPSPIQRALRRSDNGVVTPFFPENSSVRTQDLEPGYFDAGQFYWGRASAWEAGLDIHNNGRSLILPEWRVVDIDLPSDWERAELLYSALAEGRLL